MKHALRVTVYLALAALLSCDFLQRHGSAFDPPDVKAEASSLSRTRVTAHLEEEIRSGENLIWCSTFQIAWNEAIDLMGEELHFVNEPPMVAALNKRVATRDDLDSDSFVALAGRIGDGILGKIDAALEEKFEGQADAQLVPDGTGLRPQDIVTYAYLFKKLNFAAPFEELDTKIPFDGQMLVSFGVDEWKADQGPMRRQVHILDYVDGDDFVIELQTESETDELLLAKIPTPEGKSLAETVADLRKRLEGAAPAAMGRGDILRAPKMRFELLRNYDELLNKKLLVSNPDVARDLVVVLARQSIKFQLDQRGVVLKSESTIAFGCSAAPPLGEHRMIFDKPFLILMRKKGRDVPYFLLWVDNAELFAETT